MKRIFCMLFLILCGFSLIGGGTFLLSGCSSSQTETGGGGTSSPSEDEENPDDGEDGSDDDNSNDSDNDEDGDLGQNATSEFDWTIMIMYRTGAGDSYSLATQNDNDCAAGAQGYFDMQWADENYKLGNLTAHTRTQYKAKGKTLDVTNNHTYGAKYMHYDYWNIFSYRRLIILDCYYNTGYTSRFFGIQTSTDNSSGRSYENTGRYFIYRNNNAEHITTDQNTATSGCENWLKGTYYLLFREKYSIKYYSPTSSSLITNSTQYAGIGFNLVSAPSTRTGYTFAGWKETSGTGNVFPAYYYFEDSWSDSDKTFVAQWIPNTYTVTYNLNGGSGVTSNQVRYNDTYGKSNLYVANTRGDLNGLSNNIFTINHTNGTSSTSYRNFFQPFDRTYASNTKYTAVIEVLSYSGSSFYLRLTSPNEGGTNLDVATDSTGCTISGTGRYTVTFTTRSSIGTPTYNLRSYIPVDPGKRAYATFRISIFTGDIYYDSFSYATAGNTPSTNELPTPTKTHYTFAGWYKNSSLTTKVSSTSIVSTASNHNLYAKWSPNTYSLKITYYGGTTRQSNTTNLNITAANCTVSSSSIATGGTSTISHTYTTTSYSVVLKLSNSASYDYYLRTGSNPTTSSYTKLYTTSSDSYTYTWTPDSNDTLSVYVKQRYTITYSANNGSGTLPTSNTNKYKIHGTALTLGTNNLTRTSYTANGWNANTSGTGTHYASGGSYTTNASDTLYADWTPKTSTIKVQIKTSTNGSSYSNSVTGGTVSVRYYYDNNNTVTQSSAVSVTSATATTIATNALISQTVSFTPSAKSGYVFVGISTSSSAPNSTGTTFTPTTSGATYTINVFFKVLSSNQLKYDSTDKYWYFEHGEYPQSYVGTSMNNTLNSVSPTKSGEIKYNDGTTNQKIEVYTYNSKRYARLQATSTQTLKMSDGSSYTFNSGTFYWFEVEPIRWRVSDYGVSSTSYPSGWSTYGTYKTNFTVVSDRILTLGAVETSDVNEGWAFSSSDMYSNISGLNKTASTTNFSAGITNKQASTGRTYYKFGNAGQQDKVVSVSVTEDGVRVASIEEIDDYLTDYSAKASDMVCFLLGCGTDDKVNYWTRNLGAGLGNGQIVTKAGITKSSWLDNVQGVRLALTMGNGSRI